MHPRRFGCAECFARSTTNVRHSRTYVLSILFLVGIATAQERKDGAAQITLTGELKTWHKVTLALDGPFASERDASPNPFTDLRMDVVFKHESGSPEYLVPGYFAADGNAAETGAESGTAWRAHLSPDKPGNWIYTVRFSRGKDCAVSNGKSESFAAFDGKSGEFAVTPTDKRRRDFRAHGRLQYVGKRYLRFAGSGEYFLKAGPDAPETLLAYEDFDGTSPGRARNPRPGEAVPGKSLHKYEPHLADWHEGDPTWRGTKGKGLIGAINYLAEKGLNAISFLPYNAGGDGDNVWPFVARDDKMHYDCSKLDQWGIVFDHAQSRGLYLHFKLQENELDDNRVGHAAKDGIVPESLDGGALGKERKLYCRELIARFGHLLALNWNLGEENTQSHEEQRAMAQYIRDIDPYDHHIVVHTFPDQQDKVYAQLLGDRSFLTGVSLQNSWDQAHQKTLRWIEQSEKAGRPWVVANDEQNPAGLGVPPDEGYQGFDGIAAEGNKKYTRHDIRKHTLWGNLMAGGAGVEYYFGYKLPQNDLVCEDFRSRDKSWDACRIAIRFFKEERIPFWEMTCADELVGNASRDNSRYCFAKPGEVYLVYLPNGGAAEIDLAGANGKFIIKWFNPRVAEPLRDGTVNQVTGGAKQQLGEPPVDRNQDWLILLRKQ